MYIFIDLVTISTYNKFITEPNFMNVFVTKQFLFHSFITEN